MGHEPRIRALTPPLGREVHPEFADARKREGLHVRGGVCSLRQPYRVREDLSWRFFYHQLHVGLSRRYRPPLRLVATLLKTPPVARQLAALHGRHEPDESRDSSPEFCEGLEVATDLCRVRKADIFGDAPDGRWRKEMLFDQGGRRQMSPARTQGPQLEPSLGRAPRFPHRKAIPQNRAVNRNAPFRSWRTQKMSFSAN